MELLETRVFRRILQPQSTLASSVPSITIVLKAKDSVTNTPAQMDLSVHLVQLMLCHALQVSSAKT